MGCGRVGFRALRPGPATCAHEHQTRHMGPAKDKLPAVPFSTYFKYRYIGQRILKRCGGHHGPARTGGEKGARGDGTCATWAPTNVLYSCSDDQTILKWDQQAEVTGKCCELDAYVTSIAWMPSVGRGVSDVFAVSACDGSFRLVTGSGREEKRVAAHHGACLRVLWNAEGSALYSAGEDGEVKCWSKTGHLRSTLVKAAHPVYAVADGPGGDALAYVCDRRIHVAPVGDAKARQATSWVAHDQVALALDWDAANGLLVSGGEDCRYKV